MAFKQRVNSLCREPAKGIIRASRKRQNLVRPTLGGYPPMATISTARSTLAIFLSFSLLSLTCIAQPLAEPGGRQGTRQFPEDQPGFPQYPGAQSGSQTGTTQYPEDRPGFPQYPSSQPTNQ